MQYGLDQNNQQRLFICNCSEQFSWRRAAPVVVGFEGPVLVQAQVLRLLVRQLGQVGLKCGQMQAGHIFI